MTDLTKLSDDDLIEIELEKKAYDAYKYADWESWKEVKEEIKRRLARLRELEKDNEYKLLNITPLFKKYIKKDI